MNDLSLWGEVGRGSGAVRTRTDGANVVVFLRILVP